MQQTEPMQIEHTEITAGLFHLRPPRVTEAQDLLDLRADPDVAHYTPRLRPVADLDLARAKCAQFADWTDQATFSILESSTERYAGHVMVFDFDRESGTAQAGYRIAPWARGRGAASTALRAATGWAFAVLGFQRLWLVHAVTNPASCRVAEKSGYLLEGTLRSSYRCPLGELHDEHVHARLAGD